MRTLAEIRTWFIEGPNAPDRTFYLQVSLRLSLYSVFSTPVDHTNDGVSTASSVMLVSGANLNPTASTSALVSTHIIVFKHLLQADAIDIAQVVSYLLDGVSEVLLMAGKFSKSVCPHAVLWNCAGTLFIRG